MAATPPAAARPEATPPALPRSAGEDALDRARASGDPAATGAALLLRGRELADAGRGDDALSLFDEATRIANARGDDRLGREAAMAAAELWAARGDRGMERTWRDQADQYLARMAAAMAPPAPATAAAAAAAAAAADQAAPAPSPAVAPLPVVPPPPPAASGSRWLWLLLPLALAAVWAWLRGLRRAEALESEAARLERHRRQLRQANSSLAEQAERLRQAAVTDALTGAMTRTAFARRLDEVLAHAAHYRKPVALMVFDCDHFKAINDGHGHLTGDAALRFVAGVVREHLGSDDLFGRFGGDEFLIACADHDADAALALAEAIRRAVVARAASENPAFAGLSLSLGIAFADAGRGWGAEGLFHDANAALYAAKRAGRDRSVVADASTPEPPGEAHLPRSLTA